MDFRRAETLVKKEVIPRDRYDRAKTNYEVTVAQVKAAGDASKQLEASLETQKAVIKQTESGLLPQQARFNRKRQASRRHRTEPGLHKRCMHPQMATSPSELLK